MNHEKGKMRLFLIHTHSYLFGILIFLSISCNQDSLQEKELPPFEGISKATVNSNKQLSLEWNTFEITGSLQIEYELYLTNVSQNSTPFSSENLEKISAPFSTQSSSVQGLFWQSHTDNTLQQELISQGPAKIIEGSSLTTLETPLTSGDLYLVMIRPKIGGEYRSEDSTGKIVLLSLNHIKFDGFSGLTKDSENEMYLNWQLMGPSSSGSVFNIYRSDDRNILDLEAYISSGEATLIESVAPSSETLNVGFSKYSAPDEAIKKLKLLTPTVLIGESRLLLDSSFSLSRDELIYIEMADASSSTQTLLQLHFLSDELSGFKGIESIEAVSSTSARVHWTKAINSEVTDYNIYLGETVKSLKKQVSAENSFAVIDDLPSDEKLTLSVRASDAYAREDRNTQTKQLHLGEVDPNSFEQNAVTADSPDLSVTPSNHDFGQVSISNSSSSKSFKLVNTGGSTILGQFVSSSSQNFSITNDSCSGETLTQSSFCTLTIEFDPTTAEILAATVALKYSDFNQSGVHEFRFAVSGEGTSSVSGFAGVSGYQNLNFDQVDLVWTSNANAANYKVYQTSGASQTLLQTVPAPATGTTLTGLSPETSYTFYVEAEDSESVSAPNNLSVSITTPVLVGLATLTSYQFPSNPATVGDIINYDAENQAAGATTYSCFFDTTVDGSVSESSTCSSLPGAVDTTGLSSAGTLAWTVGAAASGLSYEIMFKAEVGNSYDNNISVVSVKRSYSTTNLIFGADFNFGDLTTARDNSTNWGNPQNISASSALNSEMSLGLFLDRTTSSGYAGSGTAADPYRLAFDGNDDQAEISGFNDETEVVIMGWFKPTDITSDGTLFSNGTGTLGAGIQLEQAYRDGRPYLEFTVGGEDVFNEYDTTVAAHNPLLHYRFGISFAGDTITNLGDSSATLDGTNYSATVGQRGLAQDLSDDTAMRFENSTYVSSPLSAEYAGALSTRTMETWFQADEVDGIEILMGYGADNHGSYHGMRFSIEHGQFFCKVSQTSSNISYVNTPIVPGIPYHAVMTYDEPSGELKCFVNGVLVGTDATIGTLSDSTGHNTLYLTFASSFGYYHSQANNSNHHHTADPIPFTGVLDEPAIYDEVITPSNLKSHYLPKDGGKCGTLLPGKSDGWHHLAVGYHNNIGKLYINGTLQCQFETPQNGLTGGNSNLTIGTSSDGSSPWSGSLGLLSIYNSPSDLDAEVLAHYNATQSDYTTDDMHSFLPSLVTWLDASDLDGDGATNDQPSSGSTLTEWKDLTNYSSDVKTIIGQPLVQSSVTSASVASVQFINDATSAEDDALILDQLGMAGGGLNNTTIYVFRLTEWDSSYSTAFIWGSYVHIEHRNNLVRVLRDNNNNRFIPVYNYASYQDYTPDTSNTASILSLRRSGGSVKYTLDGNENSETIANWDKPMYSHQVFIGCDSFASNQGVCLTGVGRHSNMDVFEVQLYNRYLSDSELSTLTSLLQSKWQ